MSEEDVERFTADLLLAAIDTTSVTALWLLYVLASHEDVQVGHLLKAAI
jgi:cytochrome P450